MKISASAPDTRLAPGRRVLQPTVSFNAVLPEGGTLSVRLPLPGKFSYVAQLPAFLRE